MLKWPVCSVLLASVFMGGCSSPEQNTHDLALDGALATARGDYVEAVRRFEQAMHESNDPQKIEQFKSNIRRLKREGHAKYMTLANAAPDSNPIAAFDALSRACWLECPESTARLCTAQKPAAHEALLKEGREALGALRFEIALDRLRRAYAINPSIELRPLLREAMFYVARNVAFSCLTETLKPFRGTLAEAASLIKQIEGYVTQVRSALKDATGRLKAEATRVKAAIKGDAGGAEKARARVDALLRTVKEIESYSAEAEAFSRKLATVAKFAETAVDRVLGRVDSFLKLTPEVKITVSLRKSLRAQLAGYLKGINELEGDAERAVRTFSAEFVAAASRWAAAASKKAGGDEGTAALASVGASLLLNAAVEKLVSPLVAKLVSPIRSVREQITAHIEAVIANPEALIIDEQADLVCDCTEHLPELRDFGAPENAATAAQETPSAPVQKPPETLPAAAPPPQVEAPALEPNPTAPPSAAPPATAPAEALPAPADTPPAKPAEEPPPASEPAPPNGPL